MSRYLTIIFRLADNAESRLVLVEAERINGAKVSAISHGHLMDERDALEVQISALRSENEALRKRNEELENERQEDIGVIAVWRGRTERSESRAQELETKLRAAEDAVVVLREHIEPKNLVLTMKLLAKLSVNQDGPTEERMAFKEQRCWEDTSYELLSNTAALAAQRKQEIVLEALKKIINHLNGSPSGFLLTLESFMSILDLDESEDHPLDKCPNCGGPADNGFDRCIPPNVYFCSKCDPHSNVDN